MFIIGGSNKGNFIDNPTLSDLLQGDLKHKLDFRSLYANYYLINFNLTSIVIKNHMLYDLF
jgi:hypothetical protein